MKQQTYLIIRMISLMKIKIKFLKLLQKPDSKPLNKLLMIIKDIMMKSKY